MENKTQNNNSFYEGVAELFEYPSDNWNVISRTKLLLSSDSDPVEAFKKFRYGVDDISLSDLQELYTRTFDLNPVCALEIGYHVFGENYKRGEFLAHLRETEAPFDLGQERQLPDYLPVLLRLITKLEEEELRTSLIGECMLPALDKMIKALSNTENPYRYLLETLQTKLRGEDGLTEADRSIGSKFQRASLPIFQPAEHMSAPR